MKMIREPSNKLHSRSFTSDKISQILRHAEFDENCLERLQISHAPEAS